MTLMMKQKNREEIRVPEFGGGEKIKDFPSLDQLIC